MPYKSDIEQRVERLELYGTSHVDSWIVLLEKKLDLIQARLLQLETKVFQAAGDGPVQTTRLADPTLNPVTLPVISPAPANDGSAPAPERTDVSQHEGK